jgi:hypothetical protein
MIARPEAVSRIGSLEVRGPGARVRFQHVHPIWCPAEGRIFNVKQWHRFPADEVYLDLPNGRRSIADSYIPGENRLPQEHGARFGGSARSSIDEVIWKHNPDPRSEIVITRGDRANPVLAGDIGSSYRATCG